jgi:hypothetical protein
MATISKETIAQFWFNSFPISTNYEYFSFSDSTIVQNLLKFVSEKNEDKKIFDIINDSIQQTKPKKIIRTITTKISSPKRRRSAKNTLTNIDTSRLRFSINIEVIENLDYEEEEIPTAIATKIEGIRSEIKR